MRMTSSFLSRLIELISPRACVICGGRLAEGEEVLCSVCNLHLPRTGYHRCADDNPLAQTFWGKIHIKKAASLFFYNAHSASSNILYSLKYRNHPEIGTYMGRMIAREYMSDGFFDGIDMIIYVPLARKRQRQRGYNQSREIALGINQITGIPINDNAVVRTSYQGSQTHLNRWGRQENVETVFSMKEPDGLNGKHILIIDDVVTTGATIAACAKEISKAGDVVFSVLSIGFAKS